MRISEIHVGQKVAYEGVIYVIETIDGRFGTVTFGGITAKASDVKHPWDNHGNQPLQPFCVHVENDSSFDVMMVRAVNKLAAKEKAKHLFAKAVVKDIRASIVEY